MKKDLLGVLLIGMLISAAAAQNGDGVPSAEREGKAEAAPLQPNVGKLGGAAQADIAWCKAIGGLQAGVGLSHASKLTYRLGETLEMVVKVRNVGNAPVEISYSSQPFNGLPPTIEDAKGNRLKVTMPPFALYKWLTREQTLGSGGEFVLGAPKLAFALYKRLTREQTLGSGDEFVLGAPKLAVERNGMPDIFEMPAFYPSPGKYTVEYSYLLRSSPNLSTGKLNFEILAGKNNMEDRGDCGSKGD
jgi:hypothetical protein